MNKEKCKELLEKIKNTPDETIEKAIDSLSEEMNKEEIEQAKEDLQFFNEGDYITKEMEQSANVLEEYIKELEQKSEILDKVTDKLKEDVNQKIPLAEDMDWVRCRKEHSQEILKIIEGEKK